MMRLQRVGRKNDPTYRLVVVDKRTGPKSNKNIDILGSYNPKLNHVQIDADRAKDWLSKGVQPSDTVHNILVKEKVINAKKLNVLPKKSPIVDEEALKKAEEEKAAAEAKAKEETETPSDESVETPAEEGAAASAEEVASEASEEKETVEETSSEPETESTNNEEAGEEKKEG